MKKIAIIGAVLMTAASLSVYGQGQVYANNQANTGVFGGNGGTAFDGSTGNPVYSSLVTQNGLIFTMDTAAQAGNNGYTAGSTMIGVDFSWALWGGATAGTVTSLLASDTGAAISSPSDDNVNWGQLLLQSGAPLNVPGSTAGNTVFLDLQVWEGSTFSTYALAVAGGDYAGDTGVFSNGSGGVVAGNPVAAVPLSGMPDVIMTVPEPTTLALAGLGGAALLAFRRRKA